MDWGSWGGTVFNGTDRDLIVAYNDPNNEGGPFIHSILPRGVTTPNSLDVDGFRARDPGVIIKFVNGNGTFSASTSFWKIRNMSRATVLIDTDGPGLIFAVKGLNPTSLPDSDFNWEDGTTPLYPLPN